MARKRADKIVALICSVCKSQNYVTTRNKVNMEEKLALNKYCKHCGKVTPHKETAKLK